MIYNYLLAVEVAEVMAINRYLIKIKIQKKNIGKLLLLIFTINTQLKDNQFRAIITIYFYIFQLATPKVKVL